MIACPKCGNNGNSVKCRACGYVFRREDYAGERYYYIDKLEYWKKEAKAAADGMQNSNVKYGRELFEIELASEKDPILADELKNFKTELKIDLPYVESCIIQYMKTRNEKALEKFKGFIEEEAEKRSALQSDPGVNIFTYYIRILGRIKEEYDSKKDIDGADDRMEKLCNEVIVCVNSLIKGLATRHGKGKFRLYKNEKYKDIHDHYVEYLTVLKKTVNSSKSRRVRMMLGEVY